MGQQEELIDVQSLIAAKSLAELCGLAEEYFARLSDWTHHLSKPFGSFDETPQLLINFAVVLQGLQLCPGMTVLEFGAGTCWAARSPRRPCQLAGNCMLVSRQSAIVPRPSFFYSMAAGWNFPMPASSALFALTPFIMCRIHGRCSLNWDAFLNRVASRGSPSRALNIQRLLNRNMR